ncbi:MAG: hypothetical protein K5896_01865 [Prevotella sp.]|nr:hypothetical protein [Prevotella sp.]
MKKIFTLAILASFTCLSAMAQIVLGDINFSIKDGQKVNPNTGKITVTFPNVSGVEDPTATSFVLEGNFGNDDLAFDGVEGTFASGVIFDLVDFELQPSTDYTLTISSVKVNGEELAAEGGYMVSFKTRGAERKLSWVFAIDEESVAKIKADENAEGNETAGVGTFWSVITADQRHYYHQKLSNSEIMLDADNALPMTEDLVFTANADKIYVGDVVDTKYKNNLVFNANDLQVTIPDCQEGDVVTFVGKYASKPSSSKRPYIMALNGSALAPEGLISSTGLQDSIDVPKNNGSMKFEVQTAGDITFLVSQCVMTSIEVSEAQPKLPRNYSVVAQYTNDEEETIVLKELVGKTEGVTGSTIKTNYPYWLTDAAGKVYTYGTKGSEFVEAFELKNGEGDTIFVVNYKATAIEGAVYLSEGEDIAGAVLCTSPNAAVRSSMGKSAYVTEDTKLVTLQPGTYKIRAVIFDANKTASYVCTLSKGEGEENEIYLTATATNFDEQESDLLEITEPTDITLKAGGGDNQGLDIIVIYASEDAPEDPEGIVDVQSGSRNAAVRKVMSDGHILIQTGAGIFNTVGVQVK